MALKPELPNTATSVRSCCKNSTVGAPLADIMSVSITPPQIMSLLELPQSVLMICREVLMIVYPDRARSIRAKYKVVLPVSIKMVACSGISSRAFRQICILASGIRFMRS